MITTIITFGAILINLVLAFFIYAKNTRSLQYIILSLLIVSMSLWLVSNYFADIPGAYELFWNRFVFVGPVLMATSFYFFVQYFGVNKPLKTVSTIVLLASLFFILISLTTSTVVMDTTPRVKDGVQAGVNLVRGIAYPVLVVYIISLAFLALYTLYRTYRSAAGLYRVQLQYVFLGTFFTVIASAITNVVLPLVTGSTEFTEYAAVSSVVFSSFLTYAIVRHRLFDVRLIVARSLAYALVLLTLGAIYGYFVFGFLEWLMPETQTTLPQQILYTVAAVFLAFTFQPIKRFFDKVTDRIFYRERYYTEDVLNRLGKVFVNKSNSFELLDDSLSIITNALRIEFGRLIVIDKDEIYKTSHLGSYQDTEASVNNLAKLNKQINILDELHKTEEKDTLRELNAYVLVRLTTQDKIIGYLVLGAKQSGTIYTQQDINLLEILSQELAVAIQNAKSYEEIQAFSKTLKKEVDEATAQLRESNKRLVKLDEAKDEFISMASHQLRTPLTTVKGYLSMLLEGDAGKVTKKQTEFIDMAFVSSERMVHLIADMLNVSRISTGRLTLDISRFDLVHVAQQEVKQLTRQAEARGVELTFHAPSSKNLIVNLDETKIRQVIMNFTDNAIYYSPKGKVDAYVEVIDGKAEFRVEDNGIGVSAEAQRQLFTKFFRADNAQAVRPDGTGLGLYMAKQVIEAQKGEIIFSSEEGQGSVFGFRFDLENDQGEQK